MATLDASKSRAHKDATITKYVFDFGDGSPLFESSDPIVTHEYSFIKDSLSKKHKHRKNIKEFHPKVFVIDSNNKKSKSDKEKVRVIAQTDTVPVNQAPIAKLIINPSSGVAPLQVTLDASGSSDDKGIVLYTFIVGNGEIISTTEPILNVVYSSANVFAPQVVVKDQEGLESSISASVSVSAPPVNQAPIASLSATPILGDAPLLVTFDSSASSDDKEIVNRIYIFGDGQSLTTTEAVVSHLYQQSGYFTASVQIFDQENLSSTKSVAIEVNTPNSSPIANLSVDKVRANPAASFKFDGSTSTDAENNIASYSLSNSVLGINQTNTTGLFDVVISQSGNFDFIFTVADSLGLSDSKEVSISVNAPPIALLSADKISGEAPLTVTFDSSASSDDVSIIKRDYQFAPNVFALNAGSSVSYTYNEAGVYPAKVKIYDGENLVSEAMIEITVTAPEIKTPPIAWFLIDINPDTYEVRLLNKAERGSSNIKTVSYELNGSFLANGVIYPYSEVSFQGEFGQVYQVRQIVTDEQDQTDDQIFNIVLDPSLMRPISNFKVAQSNVREVFLGAIRSFDPFDQITSIQVNWGDNTPTETLDSFFSTHQYTIAGTYSITLRVESANGLFAERTRQITVTDEAVEPLNPIANFRVESDDRVKHVRLYSQFSGTANGQILSYFWQYGDGQVGYGEQSVHFYSAGVYYARLTVTDSMNLRASQVQQIIITEDGPPVVTILDCDTFGMYAGCDFFAAHKDKQLDRVEIDWKDGSPIESFPVDNNEWQIFPETGHIYQAAGVYDISIRAVTFTGLESIATHPVLIQETIGNQAPVANLYCSVLEYTHIQCDTSGSFDPDGFITSTEISMGDGTTYQQSFVDHTYLSGGSYIVSAKFTDNLGAESIAQTTVNVLERQNEAPFAYLNCYSSGLNQLSCDSAFSADNDGFITSVEYRFDDGSSIIKNSNVETVIKGFESGGQKFVEVIVTDNEGAKGVASGTFFVPNDNPPTGDFYCNSYETLKLDCNLSYASDDAGTPSVQFEFIQGIVTSLPSSYTYASNGDKTVRLMLTDSRNQQTIVEKSYPIIANQAPIAKITSDKLSVVAPGIIHLSSTESSDPDSHAITKIWTLPDGSTRADDEFDLNIDVIGKVSVSLVVTDSYGFSSSASLSLAGKSDFTNTIILSKSSPQVPSTFTMSPTLLEDEFGDPLTFEWWINGQRKSTNANYSETFLDPGVIEIKLVSIDIYGDRYETIQSETLETHPLYFALNRYEGYAAQGEAVEFQIGNLVTDSPDYQIDITSSDPNTVIELMGNNAFKVSSSTVGSPIQLNIVATDGIEIFERSATAEFVEMQEIFNGVIDTTETLIQFAELDLFSLVSNSNLSLIVKAGLSSNNDILVEIPRDSASIGKVEVFNKNLNSEYDLIVLDAEASGSGSGSRIKNHNLTDFQVAKFNFCVFPDIAAATNNMRFLLKKSIYKNNIREISLPLSGKKLFIRNNVSLTQDKIIRTDVALSRGAMTIGQGVFLLEQSEIGNDVSGEVFRGDEILYISTSVFNNLYDAWPFLVIAHEDHHVLQNNNCSYRASISNPIDFSSAAKNIITESNADLAAFKKLRNLPDGEYQNLAGYTDFRGNSLNVDLKDLIRLGFLTSGKGFEYSNDIYFDLFPLNEFNYVDLISVNVLQNNFPENYLPNGIGFSVLAKNHLNFMIDKNSTNSYTRFGLSLPAAALEVTASNRATDVGPYGFGYLQVPVSELNSGLLDGNRFRIKISHDSTVSFPYLSNANNQLDNNGNFQGSFTSLINSKEVIEPNGTKSHILEFQARGALDNKSYSPISKEGYFSVVNDSFEGAKFQVVATKGNDICYQDTVNKFFFEDTSKQIRRCMSCDLSKPENHYSSNYNECLKCDTSNPNNHFYEDDFSCLSCDETNPINHYLHNLRQCVQCDLSKPRTHLDSTTGQCITDPCPEGEVEDSNGICISATPVLTVTGKITKSVTAGESCVGQLGDLFTNECYITSTCEGGILRQSGGFTGYGSVFICGFDASNNLIWNLETASAGNGYTIICDGPTGITVQDSYLCK